MCACPPARQSRCCAPPCPDLQLSRALDWWGVSTGEERACWQLSRALRCGCRALPWRKRRFGWLSRLSCVYGLCSHPQLCWLLVLPCPQYNLGLPQLGHTATCPDHAGTQPASQCGALRLALPEFCCLYSIGPESSCPCHRQMAALPSPRCAYCATHLPH